MLECYYTSTGIVFSVSASGTGTFENFMNTGSFQSEPDGSCKGNLSQIIGTVRDGVYFVAIENADNALNSSSSVG
jgi:hypothetical protein